MYLSDWKGTLEGGEDFAEELKTPGFWKDEAGLPRVLLREEEATNFVRLMGWIREKVYILMI